MGVQLRVVRDQRTGRLWRTRAYRHALTASARTLPHSPKEQGVTFLLSYDTEPAVP